MTNSLDPLTKQRLRVYIMRRHMRFFGLRTVLGEAWRG